MHGVLTFYDCVSFKNVDCLHKKHSNASFQTKLETINEKIYHEPLCCNL